MKKIILAAAVLISGIVSVKAQDKATMTVGADLVSSYVWRGQYQTGASIQPTLGVSYKGLSVGAWGSTDLSTAAQFTNPSLSGKEFDLSAFYTKGAFKVGLTDYWWSGQGAKYFQYKEAHYFEGTVGYVGSKFSLTWNTIFAGDGDKKENGDQKLSTYVEGGYNFNVGETAMALAVGVTPGNGMYSSGKDGLQVANISLKATKQLKISESLSLPVYVQGIIAPAADNAHLVFGVTF